MSEDQKNIEQDASKPQKTDSSGAILKLFAVIAIVFALTKWGVPLMNGMVDTFKTEQESKVTAPPKETVTVLKDTDEVKLNSKDSVPVEVESTSNKDDTFKAALEKGITQWIRKAEHPEATATVKYINANKDGSRLAVEYRDSIMEDEMDSKEMIFTRDEFGIYIYMDSAGVRQIRVRESK